MSSAAGVAELTIRPEAGEVRRASLWLAAVGAELELPEDQLTRLDLCLNEALANILAHGGPGALAAPIHLQLWRPSGARRAELRLSDGGVAFDPLSHQSAPLARSLAEIEPGGLGFVMIRESADAIAYRRENGRNLQAFTVSWDGAERQTPGCSQA